MTLPAVQNQSVCNRFHVPGRFSPGRETFISEEIRYPFLFDSLVLSLNYRAEQDACILLEAQLKQAGVWSKFFKLGIFSPKFQHSFSAQKDSAGEVEVDMLRARVPAESFRYRLQAQGEAEVFFVASSVTRADSAEDFSLSAKLPEAELELPVRPISQTEQPYEDAKRICSPVSLTMALNSLGFPARLPDVMSGVFDSAAGIYGNWLFNTAYAGLCGLEGFVRRFERLDELEEFVSPVCMTVASIGYRKGELSGAAVEQTPGHLVLVRGFGAGRVLVSDPAAHAAKEVNRSYDAEEFARVWLKNKKGVSYIVRKK